MDADLFERWFVIADQDHDGVVSGSEAVEFFGRSNLSQETLFQVLHHSPPRAFQWNGYTCQQPVHFANSISINL